MKIGIINPHQFGLYFRQNLSTKYNVHGYAIEFIKKYKPVIFLSSIKKIPATILFFKKIRESVSDYRIILNQKSFLKKIDVLLNLTGDTYRTIGLLKGYKGLKVYHIMDPQYKARELNILLNNIGVDYLLGYNSYDRHSEFVRKMYPNYTGKIIGIPFGYADIWQSYIPFEKRINRALLTGTVATFPKVNATGMAVEGPYEDYFNFFAKDYFNFFAKEHSSTHDIRFIINNNILYYAEYVDSKIQLDNEGSYKNPNLIKDVVGEFNKYKFFINDESLLNFCPIRTYEGIAAGCVMIAHQSSCYDEWGFRNKENAIMFNAVEEIPGLIKYYINNIDKLVRIREQGMQLVREHYNHKKIAELLYRKVFELYNQHYSCPGY